MPPGGQHRLQNPEAMYITLVLETRIPSKLNFIQYIFGLMSTIPPRPGWDGRKFLQKALDVLQGTSTTATFLFYCDLQSSSDLDMLSLGNGKCCHVHITATARSVFLESDERPTHDAPIQTAQAPKHDT
ncbi:hypothetical protein FQN50_009625 [Emmonsiellopsis sp. PD_5]|nr:hypothetical protein FQN50_009625 [Emmonsiellopsis sp. PD_5]